MEGGCVHFFTGEGRDPSLQEQLPRVWNLSAEMGNKCAALERKARLADQSGFRLVEIEQDGTTLELADQPE